MGSAPVFVHLDSFYRAKRCTRSSPGDRPAAKSTRHRRRRRGRLPRLASGLDQVSFAAGARRLHAIEMNKPAPDFFEGGILGNGGLGRDRLHPARCGRPVLRPQQRLGHPARREQSGQAPDVRRGLGAPSRLVGGGRSERSACPDSRPTAPPRSPSTSPTIRTPGSGTIARRPARITTRSSRAHGHVDHSFSVSTAGEPSCSGIGFASTPGNARSRSSSRGPSRRSRSSSR